MVYTNVNAELTILDSLICDKNIVVNTICNKIESGRVKPENVLIVENKNCSIK